MKTQGERRRSRVGFFVSSWTTFLVVCYMVFANAGQFDAAITEDFVPYVGFAVVAGLVGMLLWIAAGRIARDEKLRIF